MRHLACLLFLAATAALGSSVGDPYEKVVAEKGAPKSEIQAGAVRILNYPDVTIKMRDNVVVSINAVVSAPAQPSRPTNASAQRPSAMEQIATVKKELKDAIARVNLIVNQPVPSVPRTPELKVAWYGDGWFHPGAVTPDFSNVDVRKTQETSQYDRHEYVSSPLNPGVAFPGGEIEFNSMTKFFYLDRSVPKKRLTEPEMIEINRLYRIIGRCNAQLSALGAQ
jgi:hypothetical protein